MGDAIRRVLQEGEHARLVPIGLIQDALHEIDGRLSSLEGERAARPKFDEGDQGGCTDVGGNG